MHGKMSSTSIHATILPGIEGLRPLLPFKHHSSFICTSPLNFALSTLEVIAGTVIFLVAQMVFGSVSANFTCLVNEDEYKLNLNQ